jgi:hypothetical protein
MDTTITLARSDPPEEQWQKVCANLAASFHEAQSAWDVYRDHLIEHGLLPSRSQLAQNSPATR